MSVSMFASSAFGSIGNELKGNRKETVKSRGRHLDRP